MNAYDISILEEHRNSIDLQIVKDALYVEIRSLWLMSRLDEAVKRSNDLLEMSTEEDSLYKARALNVIGNVFYDLSNYDRSLDYYRKGLQHSRIAQDRKSEAAILNNIGEIYLSLEAYEQAHSYYAQSMSISKEIDDATMMGMSQLNFGESYFKQGRMEEAYEYVMVALQNFTENEDYISLSYSYYLMARIQREEERIDKAKSDLTHAIKIMRRLQDYYNLNKAYIEMIDILIEEENFEDGLEYIEDGLDISERLKAPKEKSIIALYAAEIYERLGQYHESLNYHKMYVDARLQHENEKGDELLNNINAQIKIDKAEHEKEIYRLRNVELRKKSDEIQKLYNDMRIINTIGQDITSTLEIKKVLYLLYEKINKLMDATSFGIILLDKESNQLDLRLFLIYGQLVPVNPIDLDDDKSLAAFAIRRKKPILIGNVDQDRSFEEFGIRPTQIGANESRSVMMVPLILQNEAIGAITVQSTLSEAYKDYHFNLIKALAAYIAIAIKNSQESQKLSLEIEERIKTQNELEILNERLSRMSYIDALTQIPNRRSFVDYFERELYRAKRQKESIVLLIIDIDYFKEYNDNYGHVEGDKCLTRVAQLLKTALKREIDFVARYGGDEFVAVLSNIENDGGRLVAEQIVFNVKEAALEHVHSPIEDIITITIGGIACVPEQDMTMEQIIHYADNALYVAKDKGRNQISFYNE
jgi:diguanylate cyclase (GGDEF)-like protein